MQVKKIQLEVDLEQQTGSKLGNDYIKAVYCHPAELNWTSPPFVSLEILHWRDLQTEEAKINKEGGMVWK